MREKNKINIELNQLPSTKNETVCAVVVTYNRKKLLLECLEALKRQTRPIDAIYIIDNASTDGTPDILLENNYILKIPPSNLTEPWEISFSINNSPKTEINSQFSIIVHYVRMYENTGGAGGFYEGVKRGYKKGYDWLWLMDDDGKANVNCLEKLFLTCNKLEVDFTGSLVININNDEELSFCLSDTKGNVLKNLNDVLNYKKNNYKNYLEGSATPFNGILISKKLIKSIGFPKKEMFIWGDEVEYLLRAKFNGYKIITAFDAIYKHPKPKTKLERIMMGKASVTFSSNRLKEYCRFRNMTYNMKHYNFNFILFCKYLFKFIWYFLFTRNFDFKNLHLFIQATLDGLMGNFDNHKKIV